MTWFRHIPIEKEIEKEIIFWIVTISSILLSLSVIDVRMPNYDSYIYYEIAQGWLAGSLKPQRLLTPIAYPPGLSIIILPGVAVNSTIMTQLIILASFLAFLSYTWRWINFSLKDRFLVFSVYSLIALNPVILYFGTTVLAEIPFMTLVYLSLWKFSVGENKKALIFAALSTWFKSSGLILMVTEFIFCFNIKHYFKKEKLKYLVLLIILVIIPIIFQIMIIEGRTFKTHFQILFLKEPYDWDCGTIQLYDLLERILINIKSYIPYKFTTFLTDVGRQPFPLLIGWTVLVLMLIGMFSKEYTHQTHMLRIFVLLYFSLIILWPWKHNGRLLLPILPIGVIWIVCGIKKLTALTKYSKNIVILFTILTIVFNLTLIFVRRIPERWQLNKLFLEGRLVQSYQNDPRMELALWLKRHLPKDAVILTSAPAFFSFWAQRKSACYPPTRNQNQIFILANNLGVTHVVLDHSIKGGFTKTINPDEEFLLPLINKLKENHKAKKIKSVSGVDVFEVKNFTYN